VVGIVVDKAAHMNGIKVLKSHLSSYTVMMLDEKDSNYIGARRAKAE
jgi:hypothetical protein